MNPPHVLRDPPADWWPRPPAEVRIEWDAWADGLLLTGGVLMFAFALAYTVFARFWKTPEGSIVLALAWTVVGVFALNMVGTHAGGADGNYPLREYLRIVVYAAAAVVSLGLNVVFWWRRRRVAPEKDESKVSLTLR